MISITKFQFEDQEIRFVDGKPIANDVAKVLGYSHPKSTISKKVKSKNKMVAKMATPGGIQSITVLEEAGIYQLIFSSKLEKAQEFQDWIFEEVLPSIQKTGIFQLQSEPKTRIELAEENIVLAQKQLALLKELEMSEAENQLLHESNQKLSETVDQLFDYSSIIRVATFNNVSEKLFKWQTLKAMSKKLGYEVKKVPSSRFEYQCLYSHDVWKYCYPDYHLPENTDLVKI